MQRKTNKWELYSRTISPNISYSLGNATLSEETTFSDSSDINEESEPDRIQTNQCAVCPQPGSSTWLFMPCKHANCCTYCSDRIEQLKQSCPTCRSEIEDKIQIFLN